jgi:hypothetical protein
VQPPPLNHLRSPPEPPPHQVPQPHRTAAVPSDYLCLVCVAAEGGSALPLWNQASSSYTSRSALLMGLSNWARPIPFQHKPFCLNWKACVPSCSLQIKWTVFSIIFKSFIFSYVVAYLLCWSV